MSKTAICIGLNYRNSDYALPDCDMDAREMETRAMAAWYNTHRYGADFTVQAFVDVVQTLAKSGKKSDTTLITYSGHGTQWYEGSEADSMQEGLCFWDGERIQVLPDDDFRHLIESIPGTVFVFLDSCFSGGMARSLKGRVKMSGDWHGRMIPFEPGFEVVRVEPDLRRAVIAANKSYYLLACEESEVSWSTGTGGLFTKSFCQVYDKATTKNRTIRKVVQTARSLCVPDQSPKYEIYGGNASKRIL